MMLLLSMRSTKLFSSSSSLCVSPHRQLRSVLFSSSSSVISVKPHFMVDYLTSALGFSHEKAIKASEPFSHLKSTQNPDSVLRFLRLQGFDDAHIRTMVSKCPKLLVSNVEKTLEPKFRAFRDLGFSGPELAELLKSNFSSISCRYDSSKIQFWRSLLGNDDKTLRRALKRNLSLLTLDIVNNITPKIELLNGYGVSDMRTVLLRSSRLFNKSIASFEALLKRTQELGFRPGSPMFAVGLEVLCNISAEIFEAKMNFFKSYAWSEDDFLSAFRKDPRFAGLSERSLRAKMDFLVERAGYTQSYIALHPHLFSYSLEKRLIPRNHVLQILKKGVTGKVLGRHSEGATLHRAIFYSDEKFVEKFILPYEKDIPELQETYIVACAGRVPF